MGSLLAAMTIYGAINKKTDYAFLRHDVVRRLVSVNKEDFEILKAAAKKSNVFPEQLNKLK